MPDTPQVAWRLRDFLQRVEQKAGRTDGHQTQNHGKAPPMPYEECMIYESCLRSLTGEERVQLDYILGKMCVALEGKP